MNFDDGAMLPHMSQAFTVCRLHLLEHGIQCGVPFTVTFHLEREASVHMVHLSGMSLVSPVLPCAHAKDLDHLLVHSRYSFFFMRSTKHCTVVLLNVIHMLPVHHFACDG